MGEIRNPIVLPLKMFGPLILGYIVLVVVSATGTKNPGILLLSLFILLVGVALYVVFLLLWVNSLHKELNQVTNNYLGATLWTWMMIVPIMNIIAQYKLADHIHRAQLARGVTGLSQIVVFLLLFIVSPVGIGVAQAEANKIWALTPPPYMPPPGAPPQPAYASARPAPRTLTPPGR